MNTIIIRINKAMPILKSQFGYPNISLLSSSSSSINNNINIENTINQNNMMMMVTMNASAASYHPDLHAGSSSHSQEPTSQTVNVDEFGSRNNNNRKKKGNEKNIDDKESKAYHAKNMDCTHVQFAT
jgi:hypothetical protein